MIYEGLLRTAAIVCHEVAINGSPILLARRSVPEDESDSGWQFLCGVDSEDLQTAQVWALDEVLRRESSLSEFIMLPPGTTLRRLSVASEWKVENSTTEG